MAIKTSFKKNPLIRGIFSPYIAFRRKQASEVYERAEHMYDSFMSDIESGSVVIRVKDFSGRFEMGIHTSLLKRFFMFHEFEQPLAELVSRHISPSKDVLDVGANIGLFTVLFAKSIAPGSRVLAAEPTSQAMAYLKSNIRRNEVDGQVILYNGVLANKPGDFKLHVVSGMEEYSSLGFLVHDDIMGQKYETASVKGETVDRLVSEHSLKPGFMKIDTEGAEHVVLTGARQTIKEHKPIILSELSDKLLREQGSSSHEVMEMLEGFGYVIRNAYTEERLVPEPFEGEILALPGKRVA